MDGIATLFSVVPNAMILVDAQGAIVLANERLCHLFGYAEGALAGRSLADLMPQRFRETHAHHLEAYFRAPYVRELGIGMELTALHADGSEFPIEISLNPYHAADAVFTVACMRAITDRKVSETRIKHLNRVLTMHSRINALIVRAHDREELFREACRISVEAGAFTMAWIGLLDADGLKLRVAASYGERADEYLHEIENETPLMAGPAGTSIREDRPVWIQDFQNSPLTTPWHERIKRFE